MEKSPRFDEDLVTKFPPALDHRGPGAPAKPPTLQDAPGSTVKAMRSWQVILDLPVPILSLSHSPQPFNTVINPANGP